MENIRISTLKSSDLKSDPKSSFEIFLAEYSELIFIYPAVPTFILTFIGLLTGVLLFVHKADYENCKKSEDLLFGFLLGQMIFYYSFLVIYSNLLLQLIPKAHNLTVTFGLFCTYFVSNTGWSFFGISVLDETGCPNSVYAGMAAFTISFTFLFDLLLLVAFIVLIIMKRRSRKPVHEHVMSEVKFVEQNSAIEDINVRDIL